MGHINIKSARGPHTSNWASGFESQCSICSYVYSLPALLNLCCSSALPIPARLPCILWCVSPSPFPSFVHTSWVVLMFLSWTDGWLTCPWFWRDIGRQYSGWCRQRSTCMPGPPLVSRSLMGRGAAVCPAPSAWPSSGRLSWPLSCRWICARFPSVVPGKLWSRPGWCLSGCNIRNSSLSLTSQGYLWWQRMNACLSLVSHTQGHNYCTAHAPLSLHATVPDVDVTLINFV